MMDTALFLFGMKMHQQEGNIEFFDADFSNTLTVYSPFFFDKSLRDCCLIVNETLLTSGYSGRLMEVGKLKEISDYDLNNIVLRKGLQLSLRMNSFPEALEAFYTLTQAQYISQDGERASFYCKFADPAPNYFDAKFSTQFENCIKDKFEGLDTINEVRSDYIRHGLMSFGE